jgi:hypothetical protein
LRSLFSKGFEALLLEARIAARRAGIGDDVWRDIPRRGVLSRGALTNEDERRPGSRVDFAIFAGINH